MLKRLIVDVLSRMLIWGSKRGAVKILIVGKIE